MNLKLEDLLALRDECKPSGYLAWEWIKEPWRLSKWIGFTDSHALLCLEDSGAELPAIPEKQGKDIAKYLSTPLQGESYDLEHLRSFVIRRLPPCKFCKGQKESVCDECKGRKEVECVCSHCEDEHDAPCEACDGTGKVTCECEYEVKAAIFGQTFNLCVLMPYIRYAPGETFQVCTIEQGQPLVIGGDGWRLAIMPMRSEPEETYTPQPRATTETVTTG